MTAVIYLDPAVPRPVIDGAWHLARLTETVPALGDEIETLRGASALVEYAPMAARTAQRTHCPQLPGETLRETASAAFPQEQIARGPGRDTSRRCSPTSETRRNGWEGEPVGVSRCEGGRSVREIAAEAEIAAAVTSGTIGPLR
ncbi:hypothetical protein [Amycolatopsis panacis]|uniref:Uncharacterized protein n=1 Tax=Amycolatopsis panacis TaxID=2340917 RepID=A0A419IBN0_9PSEU|nr:hypothetical protein [Amycolatopsis panacis]RJQ92314.1 hypothetical protein D5S19_00630 [Amycolatopsis panacis]